MLILSSLQSRFIYFPCLRGSQRWRGYRYEIAKKRNFDHSIISIGRSRMVGADGIESDMCLQEYASRNSIIINRDSSLKEMIPPFSLTRSDWKNCSRIMERVSVRFAYVLIKILRLFKELDSKNFFVRILIRKIDYRCTNSDIFRYLLLVIFSFFIQTLMK